MSNIGICTRGRNGKCAFWTGTLCNDPDEYVSALDGEPCCRFNHSAVKVNNNTLARVRELESETATLKRQRDELVKAANNLIPYVSYADYCDVCGTGKCDSCSVRSEFEGAIDSVNCTINSLGSGE
jgi:hypothetical protein